MAQLLFLRFVQTSSGANSLFEKKVVHFLYKQKKKKPSLFKRLRGQTDRVSILSLPKPFASFFEDQQETQEKEFQKCFLSSFSSGITLS